MAEKIGSPTSNPVMQILFRIERNLNALAMLDKIVDVGNELKGVLVSQYLLSAEGEHSNGTAHDPQFAAQLLDKLWSEARERRAHPFEPSTPNGLARLYANRYVFRLFCVALLVAVIVLILIIDAIGLYRSNTKFHANVRKALFNAGLGLDGSAVRKHD